jgi:hypothetical protein
VLRDRGRRDGQEIGLVADPLQLVRSIYAGFAAHDVTAYSRAMTDGDVAHAPVDATGTPRQMSPAG